MDKSLFTAKFKKDYVAYFAIVIFFFIIASEITLAISIPTYFVHSDLWATNIRRQELFKTFDHLRGSANNTSSKSYEARNENALIAWSANIMANYIRKERNNLTSSQADEFLSEVKEMQRLSASSLKSKVYNKELTLDLKKAEIILIEKLKIPSTKK